MKYTLHIGFYIQYEDNDQWLTFVCPSSWSDAEKEAHFRTIVYKYENGEELSSDEKIDIFELYDAYDYDKGRHYSVALLPAK